jgi:hypothetical protein
MKSNIKKIIVLLTIILIVLLCVICYIKYSKNFDSNNFYEDEIKDSKVEKEDNNLKNDSIIEDDDTKNENSETSKKNESKNDVIKNDKNEESTKDSLVKEPTIVDKKENLSGEIKDENDTKDEKEDKSNSNNDIDKPSDEDKTTENTLSLENNRLRQNIKLKYGVNVGYKDEIDGVYVSDYVKPVKQYDDEKINKILNTIDSSLKKYPNNFFFEISKKWKPLTIFLVEKINGYAAGLTDNRNDNTVVILINTEGLLFESTLHHEMMHYIDCYLANIIGANALEESMKPYNPEGFVYGLQTNEYVYYYSTPAYFLSAYSKSNYKEDRAVIFADMMFRSLKKDYYTQENPINEKAKLISSQLDRYFDCVSDSVKEHWERFIEW